ncbi:Uncharacterized protein PCOAH_00049390 [Plasmodium coatneyi]|uniref:Uncharacterized protein n=1 Tax=Plasmodium coatneyi TaxID=208452 RepID=A0A1B1E6J8_9APIC|nr:Uncharacterized protein PCOAH_00049390 [Plasmodium coatneyi]ANQ10664.1 Uncharacterized protein PCOAH_00049390 [Plasmodium coatneyi]
MEQSAESHPEDLSRTTSEAFSSSKQGSEEVTVEELKKKVKDLELQLEYEINRHEAEVQEKEDSIKSLEEKINELENSKKESDEKDEAILNMSEKLLILSNKYDVLAKESKLQEEELKHLKNKKKYRNDKTNEFIITLKKQNEDFKKDNETLTNKYSDLLTENSGLKCSCKMLQEQLQESQKKLEIVKMHSTKEFDEKSALQILNLGTVGKCFTHGSEANPLKLEIEYKDMIIKKLMRKRLTEEMMKGIDQSNNGSCNGKDNTMGKDCPNEEDSPNSNTFNHNGEQLITFEKKLEELYQKCVESQSDNDQLKNKIKKLTDHIDDLKKENTDLLGIIDTLREYINKVHRGDVNVHQFDDLINNLLKENSTLNDELSKQKRKNMVDTYFFNKELQLIQSDKFKIIEKFDEGKVNNFPHLYEPLNVTLNEAPHEYHEEVAEKREAGQDHGVIASPKKSRDDRTNGKNSHLVKSNKPVITDELVHTYMKDYMMNVQNRT